MFKRIEEVWNSRTPVYLHNGTKQNLVFQLALGTALVLGLVAWDKYQERRQAQKPPHAKNNTYYLSEYAEQR